MGDTMRIFVFILLFWVYSAQALTRSSIESYVQNAPEIREHSQIDSVVKYIRKKYTADEEVAYAVLAWIVYNVDYDDYYYRQADKDNKTRRNLSAKIPEQGDIIKTRLGVCKDIAALYVEMLALAKIKAEVVYGCYAPKADKKGCLANPHAWNAVWINKQWELADPTFAMGQARAMQEVSTKNSYNRAVKKRQRRSSDVYKARTDRSIDATWFMTEPSKMAEEHQPEDKKWYLIKKTDRKRKG